MGLIVQDDHFLVLQTVPERMRRKKRRRRKRSWSIEEEYGEEEEEEEEGGEYLAYKRSTSFLPNQWEQLELRGRAKREDREIREERGEEQGPNMIRKVREGRRELGRSIKQKIFLRKGARKKLHTVRRGGEGL